MADAGITTTGELTAGQREKIQDDYIFSVLKEEVYGQFVNYESVPADGGGASAYRQTVLHAMVEATTVLTEDTDVLPQRLSDSYFDITPELYGNAAVIPIQLRYKSHPNVLNGAGEIIGRNRSASIDRLIRNGILGATMVLRPNNLTARTDLDTTSDAVTYAFLDMLVTYARAQGFVPYESGHYVSIIHPSLAHDIRAMNEFKYPGYYRVDQDNLFNGEIGMLANIRFIESPRGKLYLGGGTVAQTATTLASAAAAGGTSITVALVTGLAAADFITVGALESATAEQVQITAVAGAVLTVRGIGNTASNFGLKYDHASGVAVTEAANVGAVPIFGNNAIYGRYGALEGKYGEVITKPNQGTLNQWTYLGWRWFGGIGLYQKAIITGEAAVSGGHYGTN